MLTTSCKKEKTEIISPFHTYYVDKTDMCINPTLLPKDGDRQYFLDMSYEERWANAWLRLQNSFWVEKWIGHNFETAVLQVYQESLNDKEFFDVNEFELFELYITENDDSDFVDWYNSQKSCYFSP